MSEPSLFGIGKASDRLGWWSLFFIAEAILAWRGLIRIDLVSNLILVVILFIPIAAPKVRLARHALAAIGAIALLYSESWLPSISRVASQAGLVAGFSGAYLAELAGRFMNVTVIAMLAAGAAAYFVAARFVRVDIFAVAAVVISAVIPMMKSATESTPPPEASATKATTPAAPVTPEAALQEFYAKEATRVVQFAAPPADAPPFDVVFLHICSLSWDDLEATGLADHALLKSFDIVLKRYNSVATYSGPAAIRILRATCGQAPHKALYEPTDEKCYLLASLSKAGFETQVVLNHDGYFDDFLKFVKAQNVTATPMAIDDLPVSQRSFDKSRIREDKATLFRWLDGRPKVTAPRTAVYYNSISLHDGNLTAAGETQKSLETYKPRLKKLLDDVDAFMKKLETSGRRAIVVLIPEHGGAVRGDATQIAGLREIPSPSITRVPVMIRVMGPDAKRTGEAVSLAEPTSYLAVSHIVSRMLAKPPFGAAGFSPTEYTAGFPITDYVSENEGTTMIQRGDKFLVRQERDAFREYPR